jgi:uncharacterized protein (DUF302 family)
VPADIEAALAGTGPVPGMTEQEHAVFDSLIAYRKAGYTGYLIALTSRPPAVVGYGLTDSPVGLAAFFLWHPGFANWGLRRRSGRIPDERRRARQLLPVLADQHRHIGWSDLLAYPNLAYFNDVNSGGHFAAWEQPKLFTEELRPAFRLFVSSCAGGAAQFCRSIPTERVAHELLNQGIAKGATMSSRVEHMVELTASGDADQVEARLHESLDAHGLQLFARIDHAAGARKAGVELRPDVLLIFGNPSVGTPLMQADPRVGIELPLRMLIWQDQDGTHVGYLDPRELADRYALDGHQQTLERQTAVLTKLAAAAAG